MGERGSLRTDYTGSVHSEHSDDSGRTTPSRLVSDDKFEGIQPPTRAGTPELRESEAILKPTQRTLSPDERLLEARQFRDAARKSLGETLKEDSELKDYSSDAIKYTHKTQGLLGVRLLRERQDAERVRALRQRGAQEDDPVLRLAESIVEQNQRIQAEEQSRLHINQQNYQERVSKIRALTERLRVLKTATRDPDGKLAKRAVELSGEIREAVAGLEAYDKQLREEYKGVEPYPSPFGRAQGMLDRLKSWFTKVETRTSPTELLIEYSLATHGLRRTDEAYLKAIEEFRLSSLEDFKQKAQSTLSDIWEFIDNHPVLASKMASKLGQMAILLSGDSSAGATIQNAIAQRRYEYRAMDLLRGKGYQHEYAKEFENPLTPAQIALLDLVDKAPYVLAAIQGSRGLTAGGALGFSLGGPIGGAVGSMVELEGQNVLAEGLERDFEVWASALSFSFTEGDLSTVFNADFSQIVSAVFKFMKPGFRAFSQRGQAEKMHDVVKNTFSDGLMKAMRESAKGSFSKPLSDVAVNEASEPILFAINLSKFLKAYRMVPASALESFKSAHGGLHDIYDLLKNLDAKPGQGLQGTRGILSKFVDVEWMAWLEKNKNILTSLPVDVLKSVLGD